MPASNSIDTSNLHGLSKKAVFYLCALAIGIAAGTGAWLLKLMIHYVSTWLTAGMDPSAPNWRLLFLPVIGILLAVAFTKYIVRQPLEHGTDRLDAQLKAGNGRLTGRLTVAPLIANTLTLGFGGSAGSEGPIAYASAAMASRLGICLKLPADMLVILVGCGAGAGIAGIFTAPIGGVLFTLEVLALPMTTVAVMALIIACLSAGITAFLLAGNHFDVPFTAMSQFELPVIPHIILLGLFCGLYAMYYNGGAAVAKRFLKSIPDVWVRASVSAIVVSVMLFFFPTLYGEGYGAVVKIINDTTAGIGDYSIFGLVTVHKPAMLLTLVGGILLCKGIAATCTNSGGGVAGEYAPALFAGCMAGWFFALLLNNYLHTDLPVGNFAVVGMAAVMGAAVKAPLMAIFITVEMVDGYDFLMPVAIATAIAYFTSNIPQYIGRMKHSHKGTAGS